MIKTLVTHSLARFASVLSVCLVVAGIGWAGYTAFVKPHTNPNQTTSQSAEQIINPTYSPKPTFGCSSMKVYEYYQGLKK